MIFPNEVENVSLSLGDDEYDVKSIKDKSNPIVSQHILHLCGFHIL